MNGWLIGLAMLAPMALVALVVGVRSKAHDLESLRLEPGEQARWDEYCRVSLQIPSRRSTQLFWRARVRLTNRRLLVAQKVLFQQRHLLRCVCWFRGEVPQLDRDEGLFKLHQNFRVENVNVEGDRLTVALEPEIDNPTTWKAILVLRSPRVSKYAAEMAA